MTGDSSGGTVEFSPEGIRETPGGPLISTIASSLTNHPLSTMACARPPTPTPDSDCEITAVVQAPQAPRKRKSTSQRVSDDCPARRNLLPKLDETPDPEPEVFTQSQSQIKPWRDGHLVDIPDTESTVSLFYARLPVSF